MESSWLHPSGVLSFGILFFSTRELRKSVNVLASSGKVISASANAKMFLQPVAKVSSAN